MLTLMLQADDVCIVIGNQALLALRFESSFLCQIFCYGVQYSVRLVARNPGAPQITQATEVNCNEIEGLLTNDVPDCLTGRIFDDGL